MTCFDDHENVLFGEKLPEKYVSYRNFSITDLNRSTEPFVFRNFVDEWPAVKLARKTNRVFLDYIKGFDCGKVVPISVGSEKLDGRVFYNEDFSGLNVKQGNSLFSTLLEKVFLQGKEIRPKLIYMASVDIEHCVQGFSKENSLEFDGIDPIISMWIGTKTRIAAHNDLPSNIACVVAGKRRFTLFPPNQSENLYPGPFEFTPAGRPISLVDFLHPDFSKFPKFRKAMSVAKSSVLNAGDAIFIPSMWWHHVEALGSLNVLVNYWWRTVPRFLGTPQDVLNHAMLTLRDLPEDEKQVWRDVFEYYVFGDKNIPADHVPHKIRGMLSPMDQQLAQRIRSYLVSRLNR